MVAERAGYTVTMFLLDVSKSMGNTRTVELPDGPNGEPRTTEMTNLEWSIQFVLLKIQEMIFHGRKTEKCGVILFGTEETDNSVNRQMGGYDHVTEFIEIAQPNVNTITKLQELSPSESITGDPIDAIIVGIQTQDEFLGNKKTWTRKMVLLTDGESPIVLEDWETTAKKIRSLSIITTIIGIDFDDEEYGYEEKDKSEHKRINETFYKDFVSNLGELGVMGTCAHALQECVRPEVKVTKSALLGTVLRLGDLEVRSEEAIEINVKTSKCTAQVRPASMKKFARRIPDGEDESERADQDADADDDISMDETEGKRDVYAQLKMETEYFMNKKEEEEDGANDGKEQGSEEDKPKTKTEKVEKELLVRGFKYGATYVACPDDGDFPRLQTRKGMDICGFFPLSKFRRDFAMGEVQYVWADPGSGEQQVVFSSLVQAMLSRDVAAIVRSVSKDGMDPKMGVLIPREFEQVDCFLWVQMPFADDVRKYTFPSLNDLVSKKGEKISEHPFIPTKEQEDAMDNFVDAMDLMQAGDKDDNGDRMPWFDPRFSFNPAVHRIKQALFHAAIVTDLRTHPLPQPHPEVIKYLEPPRKTVKRANGAIEEAKDAFNVKQVPKKVARARKDGHVRAEDDDDAPLLLDMPSTKGVARNGSQLQSTTQASAPPSRTATLVGSQLAGTSKPKTKEDSETEDEEEFEADDAQSRVQSPPFSLSASGHRDGDKDDARSSQRIIGLSNPLADFKKNIKTGDIVSKAVEDFTWAIKEILLRPFASRRHSELLGCMRDLRTVCLNEDEINTWNEFLKELRESCLSKTGISNRMFWSSVQEVGRDISLISSTEAESLGGTSEYTDEDSLKFIRK